MKSKFRVGQRVIVHRKYNGEKFEATLTKLLWNGASGPCWAMTRECAEYEEYLTLKKKPARRKRSRKKGER